MSTSTRLHHLAFATRDVEATVAFSGNGVKRLMLGFAKLERSGGGKRPGGSR